MDSSPEETQQQPLQKKKPWAIIIVIILLTIAAIWLVPDDQRRKTSTPLPSTDITQGKHDNKPEGQRDGDLARAYIKRIKGNPAAAGMAYAEASKKQKQGQLADAYILYFYAGRLKHTEAALALGTMADPAYFSAETSAAAKPNIKQANKWYAIAAASGNEIAMQRLAVLRKQVEIDAAAGNSEAYTLMLQWK